MKRKIFYIFIIFVCLTAYADISNNGRNINIVLPNNVVVKVVREETLYNIKRSLVVRINKRVSKDTLRAIALQLKKAEKHSYDRTFIVYYFTWYGYRQYSVGYYSFRSKA